MKKYGTILLIFQFLSLSFLLAQSAPYIKFNSPTALEVITGVTSSDQIPLSLNYTFAKHPSAQRTEYIELITQDGIYKDDLGDGKPAGCNGIPTQWNLESGTYTWILKQYDYYSSLGTYVFSCSTSVVFTVKNTIGFETNPGGYIITDDGVKYQSDQVYKKTDTYLTIKAPDQTIGGQYYIWVNVGDNNGLDPSKWDITKYGASATQLSTSYQYTYKVKRDDNGAIIKDYLRYDSVEPPAAPQNLAVSGTPGSTPVHLSWTANSEPDISSYLISRKVNYGSWADIATVTSTSYDDPDWLYSTGSTFDVSYKIRAKDINGNISGYSNTVTCHPWPLGKQNGESLVVSNSFTNDISNYPNPFNPTTTIKFSLAKNSHVSIKIYNNLGQEVKELVNDFIEAGSYESVFDASNLPSGIYFCKIQSSCYSNVIKLFLTK